MEETVDKNYLKGFNEGYIVTQHLPDLSDQLARVESKAVRLEGFRDGRMQFTLEQVKENRPAWLKGSVNKAEQSHDKEKGKDSDR